jgi:hypothetical protein
MAHRPAAVAIMAMTAALGSLGYYPVRYPGFTARPQ